MTTRRLGTAAVSIAALLLLTGCASEEPPAPPPPPAPVEQTPIETRVSPEPSPEVEAPTSDVGKVATVLADQIVPLNLPAGEPVTELANPQREGVPLVFLVVDQNEEWLEVQLPIRPNGTTGWIHEDEVDLKRLPYSLEVSVDDRTVTLLEDGEEVQTFTAAVGTGDTPTPTGEYFLTELLRPTNDGYGPYAFGVSAYSDVLNSFGGGPGQIGLHGTPDEGSVGQAVSHGCIRLFNDDITYLAEILPLGTPITIA